MAAERAFKGLRATWFEDDQIATSYRHRPPYPHPVIEALTQLVQDEPRRILDIGCGTGDLTRHLAPHVYSIDAVDPSESMLREAHRRLGESRAGVRLIHSRIEDVDLTGQYALITAGDCLHWLETSVLLSRLATVLTPSGMLAIAYRNWNEPPQLRDRLRPLLTANAVQYDDDPLPVDSVGEMTSAGLFTPVGHLETGTLPWRVSTSEYLGLRHSQPRYSTTRMGRENSARFDQAIRREIADYCQRPDAQEAEFDMEFAVTLVWGKPQEVANP